MPFSFKPIGYVRTDRAKEEIPRHWSHSDAVGSIEIDARYLPGARDIGPGDYIYVIFVFHESPPFSPASLLQVPAHRTEPRGVFSIGSPLRPNPIGLSVLKVLEVVGNRLEVQGIDMFDGTPVLDIKPYVPDRR
jgi:tRNA-Thr(GGU) m(6)t(6)A37 methyltransferase TsaA